MRHLSLLIFLLLGACAKTHVHHVSGGGPLPVTDADRERQYDELEGDITGDISKLKSMNDHSMEGGAHLAAMLKFLSAVDAKNVDEIRETLTAIRAKANRQITLARKLNDSELEGHAELTKARAEKRLESLDR